MANETTPGRNEMYKAITVDDINQAYYQHEITRREQQLLLREKGQSEIDGILGENGYLKSVFQQTMKNYQKGWDNLVDAATNKSVSEGAKSMVGEDLYNMGLGAMAMIQMAFAPLSAFGEVNGAQAEKLALGAGVSPGAARFINITVDIGSGFIPIGMMAKSLARTAQHVLGKSASTTAKAGEKASEAAIKVVESEERVVAKALEDSLKLDGVVDAEVAIGKVVVSPSSAERVVTSVAEKAALDLTPFMERAVAITKRTLKADAERELPALAQKYGIDLATMRTPDSIEAARPMTERQLYGYLKALETHIPALNNLAKKALVGDDVDAIRFAHYATDLFTQSEKPTYTKPFLDLLMHWDADSIARGNLVGAMRTFATDIARLSPDNLIKFTIKNQEGYLDLNKNWWAISKEFYANLLLPLAWPAAFLGNTISTGIHLVDKFAGAAFSADRAAGLTMREGVYWSKGLFLAMSDGMKLAQQQVIHGASSVGTRWTFNSHIPSWASKPTDAVVAMDTFFKTILERASFYAQYAREGVHAGMRGQALGNYVAGKMANAWPPPAHIWTEADDMATNATFQNHLGKIGDAFNTITQNTPAFFYFPFFKSYVNLTKYAWNRTPALQLTSLQLYKDLAAGGVKADEAIGRLTISNLIGMYLFELAKEGYITGPGPLDPTLRKSWLATHEPSSLKTQKGWMPYINMEPFTQVAGAVASFAEVIDQLDDPTAGQIGMAITYSIMKNYVDKGSWHTVGGLMDVVQRLSKGEELTAQERDTLMMPALNVATGGPIGLRVARALDPTLHETRTFIDSWRARVPGFSATVPPRRDGYGDIIVPPKSAGGTWFSMLSPLIPKFKEFETDPVKLEGDRVQAKIPNFEWTIGGDATTDDLDITPPLPGTKLSVPLTTHQRDKLQQIYGNLINHPELGIKAQLLENEKYKNAPPALQRVLFEGMLSDYKATAKDILIEQHPDLLKKIITNEVKSVLPLVNDEVQRANINNTLKQSIELFTPGDEMEKNNLMKYGTTTPSPEGGSPSPSSLPQTYNKETIEATSKKLFPNDSFMNILQDDNKVKALRDDLDLQAQGGPR